MTIFGVLLAAAAAARVSQTGAVACARAPLPLCPLPLCPVPVPAARPGAQLPPGPGDAAPSQAPFSAAAAFPSLSSGWIPARAGAGGAGSRGLSALLPNRAPPGAEAGLRGVIFGSSSWDPTALLGQR